MAQFVIDGSVDEVVVQRSLKKHKIFKSIAFRTANGGTRTLKRIVVPNSVATAIAPGVTGRFYIAQALDQRSLLGVRMTGGAAVFEDWKMLEKLFLAMGLLNLGLIGAFLSLDGELRLLPIAVTIMCAVFLVLMRGARGEARRLFDADGAGMQPVMAGAQA